MKSTRYFLLKMALLLFTLWFSGCKKESKHEKSNTELDSLIKDTASIKIKNYLLYTEDFFDQTWDKNKMIIRNNEAIDPNGNKTADLVDFSIDKVDSRLGQTVYDLKEGFYAFSVHVKALEGESGKFTISANAKSDKNEWRNSTSEINSESWTRLSVKVKITSFGDVTVYLSNNLVKATKDNLKTVYMWGAQLEKIKSREDEIGDYIGVKVIK